MILMMWLLQNKLNKLLILLCGFFCVCESVSSRTVVAVYEAVIRNISHWNCKMSEQHSVWENFFLYYLEVWVSTLGYLAKLFSLCQGEISFSSFCGFQSIIKLIQDRLIGEKKHILSHVQWGLIKIEPDLRSVHSRQLLYFHIF